MKFQECWCKYCKTYKFPALWHLGNNTYWLEIPKNGSASMKTKYDGRMAFIKNRTMMNHVTPIIILRDPLTRFYGSFRHYFFEGAERFHRGKTFCKRLGINIDTMDVSQRYKFLVQNLDKLSTVDEVHHFHPQTKFIDQVNFRRFRPIKIQDLSKLLAVSKINHTKHVGPPISKEFDSYIKSLYKEDYEFFKEHGINL